MADFVARICRWQQLQGRHNLPWQKTQDPYRVWLSEIMLQQTQVATVIDYYQRFLAHFPTIADLAAAPAEQVMSLWAGLGYYARARNLHKTAKIVTDEYGGSFPQTEETIMALPGIGKSTAHAIMAFCFHKRVPIMDGNVKRIFCRYYGIRGNPNQTRTDKQLWALAEKTLVANDTDSVATYTQGLMDLGATICRRSKPNCTSCPLRSDCYAFANDLVDELPERAPKKTRPQRSVHMLIAQWQNQLLLEQRPNSGIWGGMLSFPEFEEHDELLTCVREIGIKEDALTSLPAINHQFTHFSLTIHAHVMTLNEINQAAQLAASFSKSETSGSALRKPETTTDSLRWVDAESVHDAALPKPARTLLEMLDQQSLF